MKVYTPRNTRNITCSDIIELCIQGRVRQAVQALNRAVLMEVDNRTYTMALKACQRTRKLAEGKLLHSQIIVTGHVGDFLLDHHLLALYAKFGISRDARKLFVKMSEQNVVAWTNLISAYVKDGKHYDALKIYYKMKTARKVKPNQFTYGVIIPAVAHLGILELGRSIHDDVVESACHFDIYVGSALIDMYAKCGSMKDARKVFDSMPWKNRVTWTSLMKGYFKNGMFEEALDVFNRMPERDAISWSVLISHYANSGMFMEAFKLLKHLMTTQGISSTADSLACLLSASTSISSFRHGWQIHGIVMKCGHEKNLHVGNVLLDMYAKWGCLDSAIRVFKDMGHRDVVSWTSLLHMYAATGEVEMARKVFDQMPFRNSVSSTAMFHGYVRHGLLDDAMKLFDEMPHKDNVSWAAFISGCVGSGFYFVSFEILKKMMMGGLIPNSDTLASLLSIRSLEYGSQVHSIVIKAGFERDVTVGNAVLNMYAKCGYTDNAMRVFQEMDNRRDVVSWTSMLEMYIDYGDIKAASRVFDKMPSRSSHSWIAIICAYIQHGCFREALNLFIHMTYKDAVCWTTVISEFVKHGYHFQAFELFKHMISLGNLNRMSDTLPCILSAYANRRSIEHGCQVHGILVKAGFEEHLNVCNALVAMYAKGGLIDSALMVFQGMKTKDLVSWNAMISGYAIHGFGKKALKIFKEMCRHGVVPDNTTFVGVLSACCQSGLFNEGLKFFNVMPTFDNIEVSMDHYHCLVDLLGRAGLLSEALAFVYKMPMEPNFCTWSCLLDACRFHKNVAIGEHAAHHMFQLDPLNPITYIDLSELYKEVGKWEDIKRISRTLGKRKLRSKTGYSWVKVNKKVDTSSVKNKTFPEIRKSIMSWTEFYKDENRLYKQGK